MALCLICHHSLVPGPTIIALTQKGCDGIRRASEARDTEMDIIPGQQVHAACRRLYCNPNNIDLNNRKRTCESPAVSTNHTLRSSESPFSYGENCLFCGSADKYGGKKKDFKLVPVRTLEFQKKIVDVCCKRNDVWSQSVRAKIECVHDLHAADAVYHQACSVNFRTGRQIPQQHKGSDEIIPKRIKLGRPQDTTQAHAFMKVITFLKENDEEQTTIGDLIAKMTEYLGDSDTKPFGFTHMKEQIKKQFGNNIMITEISGMANIVTFRSTASTILQDFHKHPQNETCDEEKNRIIQTAAKLIKNDIKSLHQSQDTYPSFHEMASMDKNKTFLPESLCMLLQNMFASKDSDIKVTSIGQAIIQAARPRVILPPVQLGLGVQLHHHFGSKFLIDTLHKHGFCCSYSEVTKFERSAAVTQGVNIPNLTSDNFIQYVADNVDHNIRTIDGNNTFHGMGMIATVMPGTTITRTIPRLNVTSEDITGVGHVNIENFMPETNTFQSLIYKQLQNRDTEDLTAYGDMLWDVSWSLKSHRPSYLGTMQMVHRGDHPGESSVMFLPMIDMNPGDLTCIHSTLLYVSSHAKCYGVTPIVTFDQPLWWKALTIIESMPDDSELRGIELRLGGFHTQMSFLGSIGHTMAGSGLQEVLECIYADNAVIHMLSGKAISRAVRGHIIISGVLNSMLMSKAFGIPLPTAMSKQMNENTSA
jgi:hypothetical protein